MVLFQDKLWTICKLWFSFYPVLVLTFLKLSVITSVVEFLNQVWQLNSSLAWNFDWNCLHCISVPYFPVTTVPLPPVSVSSGTLSFSPSIPVSPASLCLISLYNHCSSASCFCIHWYSILLLLYSSVSPASRCLISL